MSTVCPMDARPVSDGGKRGGTSSSSTLAGRAHLVLAGGSALCSMAAQGCVAGWAFQAAYTPSAWYSIGSLAATLVTGGVAAALAARHSPVLGAAERLTIGCYLQWCAVLPIVMAHDAAVWA